jgi:hypothetical protein
MPELLGQESSVLGHLNVKQYTPGFQSLSCGGHIQTSTAAFSRRLASIQTIRSSIIP